MLNPDFGQVPEEAATLVAVIALLNSCEIQNSEATPLGFNFRWQNSMRSPKEHRQAHQVLIHAVVNEALRQELPHKAITEWQISA